MDSFAKKRKIIHIDMDAFYASVEIRDNPSLKGNPVAVGAKPEERGVLCTANYEARAFGVHSAMATSLAFKKCPSLILIPPNFKKYTAVSKQIRAFVREYTDIIEPLSLDECYIDVSALSLPATEIALRLKERIKNELHLTASAGVSVNKLLAKIASDMNKPDGLTVIKPQEIDGFMKNLKVSKLFGVGKVTQKKMSEMGISTCMDLQKMTIEELYLNFGKFGCDLYNFCRGIDNRLVISERKIKSIASECTFPSDSTDMRYIREKLFKEVAIVCDRLIKNKFLCKTVTLKVKYGDFKLITRSYALNNYSDSQTEIYNVCLSLFEKTEIGVKPIRLIGVSLTNFFEKDSDLFDGTLFKDVV